MFWPNRTEPKCGEEEPLQWLDLRLIRHSPALEQVLGRAKMYEHKSLPHQGILNERGDMMDAEPRNISQGLAKRDSESAGTQPKTFRGEMPPRHFLFLDNSLPTS